MQISRNVSFEYVHVVILEQIIVTRPHGTCETFLKITWRSLHVWSRFCRLVYPQLCKDPLRIVAVLRISAYCFWRFVLKDPFDAKISWLPIPPKKQVSEVRLALIFVSCLVSWV